MAAQPTHLHQLYDFVRPSYEDNNSVWRVVEINGDRVTAEKRPNQLTRETHKVIGSHDLFISLEEGEK